MAAPSQSSTSLRVVRGPSDTVPNGTILGVGAPSGVALGNAVKLTLTVLALPLALTRGGLIAAVLVLASADALRYVVLSARMRRHGLIFVRQDLAFSALFGATAVGVRMLSGLVGLTSGLSGWITAARTLGG